MYTQWLAQEHYRMHLMEQWPEGAHKDASIAAARSALDSLHRCAPSGASVFTCQICAARETSTVIELAQSAARAQLSIAA